MISLTVFFSIPGNGMQCFDLFDVLPLGDKFSSRKASWGGDDSSKAAIPKRKPNLRLNLQALLEKDPIQFTNQLRRELLQLESSRQKISKSSLLGRVIHSIAVQIKSDFSKLLTEAELARILALIQSKEFTLDDFKKIELLFVILSSAESAGGTRLANDYFSSFRNFFESAKAGVFLVPTNLKLPIKMLNKFWSRGLAPIGLIRGEEFTDGYLTNAQGFQQHDQSHAAVLITLIESAIMQGFKPEQVIQKMSHFYDRLSDLGSRTSISTQRVLEELYFVDSHENGQRLVFDSQTILFSYMRPLIGYMRKKESISTSEVETLKQEIAKQIVGHFSNPNKKLAHPEFYLVQNPDINEVIKAVEVFAELIQ